MARPAEPAATSGARPPRPRGVIPLRGQQRALVTVPGDDRAVGAVLRELGITCEYAREDLEALQRAAQGRFTLLVCDIGAGDAGRLLLLEQLCMLQPRAYVVVLGADASAQTASEAAAHGADVLVVGPPDPERLGEVIAAGLCPLPEDVPEDWAQASDPVGEWSAVIAGWLGWSRERIGRIWMACGMRDAASGEDSRFGYPLLRSADGALSGLARAITLARHERYDGTGSPSGMRGEEIPIEARVVALAEVIARWLPSPVADDQAALAQVHKALLEESGAGLDPGLVALALERLG